jgi:hypothetical protein
VAVTVCRITAVASQQYLSWKPLDPPANTQSDNRYGKVFQTSLPENDIFGVSGGLCLVDERFGF